MIVAYPPGGGTDIVARAIAPYIEKYLGGDAKIVVQNRSGAGREIGFSALAQSPPDGYTIGFVNTPNLLTTPIERKAPFTWQSFDLLGNIVDDPGNFSPGRRRRSRASSPTALRAWDPTTTWRCCSSRSRPA
jgi:tripartite-type tricarboxylate transporter receptor subunit TctC